MTPVFREDVDEMGLPQSALDAGADPSLTPPVYGIDTSAPSVYAEGNRLMAVDGVVSDGGVMITGSPSVFAEGKPVCRISDLSMNMLTGSMHEVTQGSPTVFCA